MFEQTGKGNAWARMKGSLVMPSWLKLPKADVIANGNVINTKMSAPVVKSPRVVFTLPVSLTMR